MDCGGKRSSDVCVLRVSDICEVERKCLINVFRRNETDCDDQVHRRSTAGKVAPSVCAHTQTHTTAPLEYIYIYIYCKTKKNK